MGRSAGNWGFEQKKFTPELICALIDDWDVGKDAGRTSQDIYAELREKYNCKNRFITYVLNGQRWKSIKKFPRHPLRIRGEWRKAHLTDEQTALVLYDYRDKMSVEDVQKKWNIHHSFAQHLYNNRKSVAMQLGINILWKDKSSHEANVAYWEKRKAEQYTPQDTTNQQHWDKQHRYWKRQEEKKKEAEQNALG